MLPRLLLGTLIAMALAIVPPASGRDLNQQLNIEPYNATRGPARNVADRWLQLAEDQLAANQYESALASFSAAAEIYDALGEYESLGRIYDNMGVTLARLGRYEVAEQLLRRRIGIARDNRRPAGEVYGLNNLGTLFLQRGEAEAAKAAFSQALAIAEAIPHDGGIGLSLSNLGLIASLEGNLVDAQKYLEAATGYRLIAGDLLGEANASNSLGDVYRRLGRDGNAIGAYRVALNTAIELGDRGVQLRALDGLREIYRDRQDWPAVAALLDRRAALTLSSTEPTAQTVLTLTYLGDYYQAIGETTTARAIYQQALDLAQELDAQPQMQQLTNRLIRFN